MASIKTLRSYQWIRQLRCRQPELQRYTVYLPGRKRQSRIVLSANIEAIYKNLDRA